MTPLVSTDPKDIVAAANCFSECVPFPQALKTYLLTQTADIATAPCVPPTGANGIGIISPTSTTLTVKWVQLGNLGSVILSYTVQLGTISGGPYQFSQTVGAAQRQVTFTGLIPGTTYYAIVTVNSFAGCNSGPSSEISGSTTGISLLTDLAAYWKLDENGSNTSFADATGNGWTGTGHDAGGVQSLNSALGLINDGQTTNAGLGIQVSTNIDTRPSSSAFTVQVWVKWGGAGSNAAAFVSEFVASNNWILQFNVVPDIFFFAETDTNVTAQIDTGINLANGVWTHLICGYDGTNIFVQVNNSARQTAVIANVRRGGVPLIFGNRSDYLLGVPAIYDECGYWKRALSTAEVTQLYNGGNGLAYPF